MRKFTVYSIGLCFASVCARNDMSIEQITEKLNKEHPTGLDHGWELSKENFRDGTPNKCPCNVHPETRKHYLFHC